MAKGLEPRMNEVGSKILWAGCNADETAGVFLVEMKDPSFLKSFGEQEEIVSLLEKQQVLMFHQLPYNKISNYFMS